MARNRSSYTRTGEIRPLRERRPAAYWTAVLISVAMVLSLVASTAALFLF